MIATVQTPKIMTIGGGAVRETAAVLARLGLKRPMIVSDPFLRESGLLQHLTEGLDAAGLHWSLFADTVPDPTTDVVEAGVARLRAEAPDCLIAFGGGSPMDTAKAMSVLALSGGKMRDHKVPKLADTALLPVICIPTTAGTGSEVTRVAVITDTETDEKMLIMGLGCLPIAAIVDYELTLGMPMRLTADTGLDSLTHAIEAYVSRRRHPMADTYALSAMARIARHIRTACFTPGDRKAREEMMLGATQGGMAFSNSSVCLVHGMSRPIGAFFHVPHGLSNAMLLPAVTRFSLEAALDRYADCARAMGLIDKGSDEAAADALIRELAQLNIDLKVPTPKSFGIEEKRYFSLLETMAEQAIASGSPGNNPKVPDAAQMGAIYTAIWDNVA